MALDALVSIPHDARATAAILAAAGPDAAVPTCPDWDLGRLVKHMGMVLAWQTANVERRPEQVVPRSLDLGLPEDRTEYGAWLVALADRSVEVLRDAPVDDECWSWTGDHTVGFWRRRLMHELAVHRRDAESAVGAPSAFEAEAAVDAIDELLTVLVHRDDVPTAGTGETIHLHATDAPGEWLITRGVDGMTVAREHAKGDVAVRGAASDLLLVILGRAEIDVVEVLGDGVILAAWREGVRF
jgi:uncharacterized protein (TIGR03083 family)